MILLKKDIKDATKQNMESTTPKKD